MMDNHQQRIVIVKLGGSSITNKSQFETANPKALQWVHEVLSQSIHPSFLSSSASSKSSTGANNDNDNDKPSFIVIHGAGSFGHYHAKKFGLKGELQPPSKKILSESSSSFSMNHYMTGLAHTRNSVKTLNNIVVSALLSNDNAGVNTDEKDGHEMQQQRTFKSINAIGLSPCMNIPSLQAYGGDSQSLSILIQSIKEALRAGLVPVLHGDAGLYGFFDDTDNDTKGNSNELEGHNSTMRSGILGGDTLVEIIATSQLWDSSKGKVHHHRQIIEKVIFLTDVDGVYTKDPNLYPDDAKLISKIEINPHSGEIDSIKIKGGNDSGNKEIDDVQLEIVGSSHEHDVTGGLKAKLGAAVIVAQAGIDVHIVRCCSQTAEQVLRGVDNVQLGTVITQRRIN